MWAGFKSPTSSCVGESLMAAAAPWGATLNCRTYLNECNERCRFDDFPISRAVNLEEFSTSVTRARRTILHAQPFVIERTRSAPWG